MRKEALSYNMKVKLINRGDEGELILMGRLDSVTSEEMEKIFDDVSDRFSRIVLNMAGMEYVSSAGLRILKNLHIKMRKREGELILCNVPRMVMEVFEMTGFAGLLRIDN